MKDIHNATKECYQSFKDIEEAIARENDKQKRKRRLIIALLILLFMLLVAGIVYFTVPNKEIHTGGWFYEQDAVAIQDAVDQSVQEGYFNMTINTRVPVYDGSTAYIGIQNVEANHFDCIVTVTLDDGTQIFKSGGIAPGQELKIVNLDVSLEKGTYEATALFEIYDINEAHTKAGQTASKITLYVQ